MHVCIWMLREWKLLTSYAARLRFVPSSIWLASGEATCIQMPPRHAAEGQIVANSPIAQIIACTEVGVRPVQLRTQPCKEVTVRLSPLPFSCLTANYESRGLYWHQSFFKYRTCLNSVTMKNKASALATKSGSVESNAIRILEEHISYAVCLC